MFLLLACSTIEPWDTGPDDTVPEDERIVVSPGALDFGELSINRGGITTRTLTFYNLGTTDEVLSGQDEPIGSTAFVIDAPPLMSIAAGEQLEVEVHYLPRTEQSDQAELLIAPTNETVRLTGTATAPVIELGPTTVDPVVVGCTGTGTVNIANTGSEDLVVTGATSTSAEFVISTFPDTIPSGGAADLTFTFAPGGGGARGTTVQLSSNDPATPELGSTISALGYEGEEVSESFRYAPSNPTDVLFAIATDDTMARYGDRAVGAFAAFVDALRDSNVDYHLTAVTSAGPCPTSTPGWADRSDTSLQAEILLQRAFDQGDGVWGDNLLDLADGALDAAALSECLPGFRREDADLAVLLVASGPATAGDPRASALRLDARVLSPASLIVSGLVPLEPECGSEAEDYVAVIESWNGHAENLCAEDWIPGLTALAGLPASAAAVEYELAEVPVPSTITVLAEGETFDAWSWDAEKNAILFDGENTPALGAEITVRYVSSVACE